jgi:hypothetical protein
MSEGFPTNSPEKAPEFSTKKDKIIAYLEKQIKEKDTRAISVQGSINSRRGNTDGSDQPLGPIPNEVLQDGGSDLSEWRAQVGHDRHEIMADNYDDQATLDSLDHDINRFEEDLKYIKGLENPPEVLDEPGGDSNLKLFNYYLEVAEKAESGR